MYQNKREIFWTIFLMMVMPVISYIMFETVAGNLRANLEKGRWVVLFNLLIYYAIYLVVFVVCNRVRLTVWMVSIALYVLAVANAFVVEFRGQPIMAMDLKNLGTAMTVAGNFTYEITPAMIQMGLLVLECSIVVSFVKIRNPGKKERSAAVLSIGMFVTLLYAGMTDGEWLAKAGVNGLDFFRFNLTYQTDGYMLCTVKSLRYLKTEEPEGYSEEEVRQIISELPPDTKESNAGQLPDNIIVIMNESLADLSALGELHTSEPVMPFLQQLKETCAYGNVFVSVLGGGTANSEFEFLTGNSAAFIPNGTIAYQMYVKEGDSSIVDVMKSYGYHTIAFHPYVKTNYNRPRVYGYYGFDEYFGIDDVGKCKKMRKYPSDQSDYEKLIQMVEDKADGERLFLFNITIQNHGGYDEQEYQSTISLTDAPGAFPQAEQYLSLIRESDRAFEELVTYFKDSDEKTVILLFGDHQPKLEDGFYELVQGGMTDENWFVNMQKQFITPYWLWANYELETQPEENIGANMLGSYLMDTLGMELPPYNRFLLQMKEEIPAVNINGFLDKEGGMHWMGEENTPYSVRLNDYHILQYNNMFDRKGRVKEIFSN